MDTDIDVPDRTVLQWARRPAELREASLVLSATYIEHSVERDSTGYVLTVRGEDEARAREQLTLYAREMAGWRPFRRLPRLPTSGLPAAAGYCLVLIVVFLLERSGPLDLAWLREGSNVAGSVRGGEWWRTFTSLTLHANATHLAGNLVFGALFVALVCQLLGSGVGLWAVLLAGAAGNGLDALLRPEWHVCIGASTAVFGAIGIASTVQWRRRRQEGSRFWQSVTPLVVGVVFLAFLGMSGERTDLVAHCTGLGSGLVLGALLGGSRRPAALSPQTQGALAVAALLSLVLAWALAL